MASELKICKNSLGANLAIAVQLLDALLLAVPPDQRIKYSQHVTAILDDPEEDITQPRIPLGVAVPLDQHGGRHFNVAAQLLGRVPPQEQAVEERGFPLGKRKVSDDFGGNELCRRGHKRKGSLPKSVSASSSTAAFLSRGVQLRFRHNLKPTAEGVLPIGSRNKAGVAPRV
jgi:hypothetical protein